MKKRFRILKLRLIRWCGFKLASNERSEIAYWLTRHVTKSNEETLREVNGEDYDEFGGRIVYAPYIPIFKKPKIFIKDGLQEVNDG